MNDQTEREESPERYMKTGFLARVAHDIRGPAGVALTAMDELETALGPEDVWQYAALFVIMRRSARRVLRIAEKLARGVEAAGGAHYSPAPMALRPVVDRFFTEVFVMAEDARVRTARLTLMATLRDMILALADISEIVPHTE